MTAYALRIDPVVMLTETRPARNAVRYAAAEVVAELKKSANKK